jgi:broad specificity phosphatase PhoE
MNKQIIFIRHGQTFSNEQGIIGGQKIFNLANLTTKGIIQSQLAGKCLSKELKESKESNLNNISFWSSTLQRAIDTCVLIKKQLNVSNDTNINLSSLLLERNMMDNEGKPRGKLIKPFESTKQMKLRLNKFLNMIINTIDQNVIIIVTHGGIMSLLHTLLNHHPFETIDNCDMLIYKQTIDYKLTFVKKLNLLN